MAKLIERLKSINSLSDLNAAELAELKEKSSGFKALPEELLGKVTGGELGYIEDGTCECGGTIRFFVITEGNSFEYWRSCCKCGKVYDKGDCSW